MAQVTVSDEFNPLRIQRKTCVAEHIYLFELVSPEGGELPPFEAGAHVTLETPNGAHRRYSLCNDPAETHRYVLVIKADPQGRGGSLSLAKETKEGDTLLVSSPGNNFPLQPATEYVFIAGGIGITPIMSMLRELKRRGVENFRLIYCTRNPQGTAFLEELSGPHFAGHVTLHHDNGDPAQVYDLWPLFEKPTGAQFYCCGPTPMLTEIRDMSGHWPGSAIHMEDFGSDIEVHKVDDRAFSVCHADSGECVEIPAHATILETLREKGHRLPSSCESGTCGTCKTPLLEGEADHRDMVLSEEEKKQFIMICVSRALSEKLVLRW